MNNTNNFGVPGHRGVPLISLWGPHTGLSYQRQEWKQVSLEQLKAEAVDRYRKYGANVVDLYPSNKEAHFDDYTCKENVAVPLHCFREYPDSDQENTWTMDTFHEFFHYARQNDFLTALYIHTWWPASYEYRARVLWKLLREVRQSAGDVLADGFDFTIDGFATEGDFIVPEEANDMLWRYHPGMYLRESAWGLNTTTANHIQPRGYHLTDGRVLMYEREEYMGLPSECWKGHDPLWRGEEVRLRNGKLFVSLQAEGRDLACGDERWAVYGGMGTIDMLLEQVNNYGRAKGRGWTTASTTAIRVINEILLSPRMKRYMGGICADPVRVAVAARLEATAKQGRYPRTQYAQGSWFIQNNYVRAYVEPDTAQTHLHFDTASQGNYTNFVWSTSELLLKDLIHSRFATDQRVDFHECEALEEAGARAILRQRCTYKSGEASMDEFRDYQLDADNPWLWLRIQRVFLNAGELPSVVSVIHLQGYIPTEESIIMGKAVEFKPAKDNQPRLVLFIPASSQIASLKWDSAGELSIFFSASESHDIKIGMMIEMVSEMATEQLTEQANYLVNELCFDMDRGLAKEITVPSAPNSETVRAIRIVNPPEGPYFVQEQGWWQMRGAQPSWNQRDTDLLKVVVASDEPVCVRPYDFIDGIVKSGWGCQYAQLLRDVSSPDGNSAQLTVRVVDINPKIWAPRLHFSRRIASAKLNGNEWHYFDGPFVFLPNHRGDYCVEVVFGQPATPHVVCTFASVEETSWDDQTLAVKTALPEWMETLPSRSRYYLAVANAGYALQDVVGGRNCRSVPDFAAVKPRSMTGPDGVANLIPREFNHPPVSGYRNIKGQTVSFEPPAMIELKFTGYSTKN